MAVVPAVRAGLPRIGREGLDRAAAGAVLPEPRRHAYLAGAGRPGFWAFEKRQADCLPQRGPAGQGARAGGTLAMEPALAAMGDKLAGAIYTPSEEAGDCRQITEAFAKAVASWR
ncbi:hypothetical protein G6F68_019060 [Rhizopus microsporus]|nr:hypothetical protein G6F68_019060 [Rhizopus microsporus]